jgi:UDPglucose 6-dehydrogenase
VTVGQVGYGFIGNAVVELFRPHCTVMVYDKAGYVGKELRPNTTQCVSLDPIVQQAEVIFVAVPTPMKPGGECHTTILEGALQDIQNRAVALGRDLASFVVVIKSTVPPGFTNRMRDRLALRLLFSPEFLTEKNAVEDFRTVNRVILGGDRLDAEVVFKYFEGVWPQRMRGVYVDHPDGIVDILQCDPTVAEMVKLSANAHLAIRVLVSNEIALICEKLGIPYGDVKGLSQFDHRIGLSHMDVPGPDGKRGVGGHCFPKDLSSIAYIANQLGTGQKIFSAAIERNLELRKDRDWEKMVGRAVVE